MVDETFRLEADHLAWTIREIQQMIRLLEEEGQDLNGRGLPGGKTGALDREDRKWSQALCQEAKRKFAQADLLRAAISSPYFRRLDIETVDGSGVSIATYVGKQPVAATDAPYDAEQFLVHDWREPRIMQLGSKDTVEFEGVMYRLWLRRDLTVDGGVLKDYSDSYLSRDEDTLSDPYLLSMLSHARGQAELTDIICSIQHRQNEIICHDGSRSFIVQGCAGSGKTQVLLHRLSFLIYNNPGDDWERTRIITINHAFSDYIADLSHRLDIGSVPRCSLEEYYLELISRLTGSAWDVPVAESEEVLPEEFLERVYSPAFRAEMEGSWDAAWEQARGSQKAGNAETRGTARHTAAVFGQQGRTVCEQGMARLCRSDHVV